MTDDVAAIEVMVWPRIYEDTRELWKDGSFLRIEGKVKVKEDRVQVTCDAAETIFPGKWDQTGFDTSGFSANPG